MIIEIFRENIPLYISLELMDIIKKEIIPLYPKSYEWFFDKIFVSNDVILITLLKNKEIIGFSILKKSSIEHKIRTVFISNKYQNKGYAVKIFDIAEKELNTKKPSFSFPEEFSNFYLKICKKRDYKITHIINGKYRKNKKEFFVNSNANDFIKKY